MQKVDVALTLEQLSQQQATVEETIAKATAARSNYKRYEQLLAAGAVTKN